MTGFEGIGDFDSDDPWQRYIAHQAAKGRLMPTTEFLEKLGTNMSEMAEVQEAIERGDIDEPSQKVDEDSL